MRFLVMVKNPKDWNGELPTAKMGAFNEALMREGVLLAAEGLQPSSKGVRIRYENSRPVVTDGPFAETKELIAGFWILQARSMEELVERFADWPFDGDEQVEIRQIFEAEDFAEEDIQNRLRKGAYKPHEVSETPNARP